MPPDAMDVPPMMLHAGAGPEAIEAGVRAYFDERYAPRGFAPTEAQQEAFGWVANDTSVVLNTPTGSGKSEVALAAHFAAMCSGTRSVYTAPTKALVNEKFIDLIGHFGASQVGLMTGDASVNRDAPILCCTAEILARIVGKQGADASFGWVVMDEFHFFGDEERGMSWLVPLVELRDTRFVLMSATLKDPQSLSDDLARWSDADAVLVRDRERPVPLEEEYKELLPTEAIGELLEREMDPVYVVSFSRRGASAGAAQFSRVPFPEALKRGLEAGKAVRAAILRDVEFNTPFGARLRKLLDKGVGVHHGGMLPKYRRAVERLAKVRVAGREERAVALISGTNTLGVGVDLPIQTVLLTALTVRIGQQSRQLSPQDYRQLAGRAGRRGHHERGFVWVLAPEHEVRNAREKAKAAARGRKPRLSQPPPGFKGWDEQTMRKLSVKPARHLVSRFVLSARFVFDFLTRPGDGLEQLRAFIRAARLRSGEEAEALAGVDEMLAAWGEAGLVTRRDAPGEDGALYAVRGFDSESTLDRPLGPFLAPALERLPEEHQGALGLLAVAESVLECSNKILDAQDRRARDRIYEEHGPVRSLELGASEVHDRADQAGRERPLEEWLETEFGRWRDAHPFFVPADSAPDPKSVAREMYEHGCSFKQYVQACSYSRKVGRERVRVDLSDSEGDLLYYLSNVYRILVRFTPQEALGWDGVQDMTEWLGYEVGRVDSSIVDEWARVGGGGDVLPEEAPAASLVPDDVTQRPKLFRRLVRNVAFGWVRALASRDVGHLAEIASQQCPLARITEVMQAYWERHDLLRTDADARGPDLFEYGDDLGRVAQTILDPQGDREWVLVGQVDARASRERGAALVELVAIERLGELEPPPGEPS